MAGEKERVIEGGQEVITPAADNKDQLGEKDLEKAAGGTWTWVKGGEPPTD